MKFIQLDPEIVEKLVIKLRDGSISKAERDQLYLSHASLALIIARDYCYKAYQEEIKSEALVGLALAINEAPTKLYNNDFTRFCKYRIMRQIRNYLKSLYNRYLKHYEITPEVEQALDEDWQQRINEMKEELLLAAENELERRFLECCWQGFGTLEIASILDLSPSTVSRLRSKFKSKLSKRGIVHA